MSTRLTFAVVASMLGTVAAQAQAPGRFGPSGRPMTSQHEASIRMGRCALNNNRDAAQALVRAADKDALEKARRRLHPTLVTCLGGAASATLNLQGIRGGIAEALVSEQDGRLLAAARSMPEMTPVRVEAVDEATGVPAVMACTVGASPTAAIELLEARAESPEEAAAFRKMVPALQQCVPASGAIRIKPMHVRGLTAVALYQRAAGAVSAASPRS